jgi:hypothetical protein
MMQQKQKKHKATNRGRKASVVDPDTLPVEIVEAQPSAEQDATGSSANGKSASLSWRD